MERAMDYGRLMQSLEGLRHSNGKVGRSLDYTVSLSSLIYNGTPPLFNLSSYLCIASSTSSFT